MRKLSIIVVLALAVAITIVFAGCSCSSNDSSKTDSQNFTTDTSQNKTSNSSSTTNPNNEQDSGNKEDYISSGRFNLTEYAKSLGYSKVEDPSTKGVVLYLIEKDGAKYFFSYDTGALYLFIDKKDGYVYNAHPISCASSPADYTLISEGQDTCTISSETLNRICGVMEYIAKNDNIEMDQIPVFKSIGKDQGSAQYYSNGMIKYEEFGKEIDSIYCHGKEI